MSCYQKLQQSLLSRREVWLVTGAAGFIGSNLVEALLKMGQTVRGLDNFSAGYRKNLDMIKAGLPEAAWNNFSFIEGDIRNPHTCREACAGVTRVLHQAALASVPLSLEDPVFTDENNVGGFLNMLAAVKEAGIDRFVYAASSAVYGDEPTLPKREERIGKPLSPYAVTKYINELYADVFASAYGCRCIGLRYFNIFGQRQDPNGAYAAVIPLWFAALLREQPVYINGDGETSRDFCFVEDCVQANLLAACADDPEAWNQVYNVAVGQRTTLNELFAYIKEEAGRHSPAALSVMPEYRAFRPGDVRHSAADISKAKKLLGYAPEYTARRGLQKAGAWYAAHLSTAPGAMSL